MNYNITVFRAEKRTIDNPYAKNDEAKTFEKTFTNPVFAFNILSEAPLTAAELKTKIAEKSERQIRFEASEIVLEENTYSNKQEDKKAYADGDLVEANNLVYTVYAKAEEAVAEKPKAKSKDKPKIEE